MQRKAEWEKRGSQLCSEEKQAISHEEQTNAYQRNSETRWQKSDSKVGAGRI